MAFGLLLPWPGTELGIFTVRVQSLNHQSTGEFPGFPFFKKFMNI